jgi:DNA-directed RNA polymerase subunit N (RpoN/RPB10)
MLPIRCFTCGHVLGHLEIKLEDGLNEIDNNTKLSEDQKAQHKRDLIDKLYGDIDKPIDESLKDIDDDKKLSKEQKLTAKLNLSNKQKKWKTRYCCRSRLISYVDLIKVVI